MGLLENRLENDRNILMAFLGVNDPEKPEKFPFHCHYFGKKYDNETLALIYSAADLTVLPSLQEAYGLTVAEAFACGTPAVAFDATGPKDIINHQENGYLANPYEPEDLANGISWVLADDDRHMKLSHNARKKAELRFSLDLQVKRYLKLYCELVSTRKIFPQSEGK
jgi:glycosyltransferase involved in cell wall biosynthesis